MGLSPPSPSSLPLPEASPQSPSDLTQRSARSISKGTPAIQKVKRGIKRDLSGYLFLLPALLIFVLFVWYPIVMGLLMSFQSVDLINPTAWVGWANYRAVLADPLFGIAWRNTFAFTGYALLFGYGVPIILALLINEMHHGKGFFRLAFYLPVMLPAIVTVFLWRWIYDPDSGLLNTLL